MTKIMYDSGHLICVYFLFLQELLLVGYKLLLIFTLRCKSFKEKYQTIFPRSNIAQQELNLLLDLFWG